MKKSENRLIVPVSEWPPEDRLGWQNANDGSGPGAYSNPAFHWSARRCGNVEMAYGRYLGWRKLAVGSLAESSELASFTPTNAEAFVAYLRESVSPVSVTTYFGGISRFIASVSPATDRAWIKAWYRKLKCRQVAVRQKTAHLRHSAEIVKAAIELMDEAEHKKVRPKYSGIRKAKMYQAGLMISLLALVPLRMRNFIDIEIGRSLVHEAKSYRFKFKARETKTGVEIDMALPPEIEPYLVRFLGAYRPILLKLNKSGKKSRHLWIDRKGLRMQEHSVRYNIEAWTATKFEKYLWPHLFRDALATSIAQDDAEHVAIIAPLLSHSTLATAKKHYIHANSIKASKVLAATVAGLRQAGGQAEDNGPF